MTPDCSPRPLTSLLLPKLHDHPNVMMNKILLCELFLPRFFYEGGSGFRDSSRVFI